MPLRSAQVVLLLSEPMDAGEFEAMVSGASLPLTSAFRLRFNTLLKLYAMETFEPERLVQASF